MAEKKSRLLISNILILAAIGLLVLIFYSPIWWVSLTAPNYPEEAFPDGVRIHFHMNGVFNGCKKVEKEEISEDEALDCVHEMDTINHYVGMYPIAACGVIERAFSPFLIALLAVMLLGFMCTKPKVRMLILSTGFGAIVVWMAMTWHTKDGLNYQNAGYLSALVAALDQDSEKESASVGSSGNDVIDRLRASLAKSEGKTVKSPKKPDAETSEKTDNIAHLRETFKRFQARQPSTERSKWNGSGSQMMAWHYKASLGRYFNNPAEINPMVNTMSLVSQIVFWGIIAAMVLLIWGARKGKGLLYWLLIVVPMVLPIFFVIEYSAWLWWYGHRLNSMGAFTVKPFMPTVFGQGKVAQFITHSYPSTGFFLMLLLATVLALAALIRLKMAKEENA
jgi:hypothetical protein